jgi:hypothetical protein
MATFPVDLDAPPLIVVAGNSQVVAFNRSSGAVVWRQSILEPGDLGRGHREHGDGGSASDEGASHPDHENERAK